MNQIQKYVLTGSSCLLFGLMIGLGASNLQNTKPLNNLTKPAPQTVSITSEVIDLGKLQTACKNGKNQSCENLHQSCKDILSVGTVNLSKLGKAYKDANIDAFDEACEDEREQAVKKIMEQTRSSLNSNAQNNYKPDPEIINGMKQGVEINEMLCKTQGINCEAAKLFRKQYEDAKSGL